ncbi:MAG: hypothetical protein LBQ47_07045 [Endomicrobium sp.]|jgi:hypothetical protein|nr:hypothetical protein [Endomicrobium sp.]
MGSNVKIICAAAGLFFSSAVFAGDVVDRKYRERYLMPQVKKVYYKTQVIVTNFFDRQTSAINGLIESFRGTSIYSYDIFTRAFIYGRGGALDAQSFTYDSAVAALAYIAADQPKKAANILNVYRQEFYCIKSDRYGLFNSYKSDKPMTKWGLSIGIDGDRMHVGPSLWIAIAAVQYTALTGNVEFLPFAIDISKWTDSLPHYTLAGGQRGAVSMGYGWGPDWSKVYSTENIVDDYALLKMLKELYESKNEIVKKIFDERKYSLTDINKELFAIERWMMEVAYDKNKKTFNMGANENGVDTTDALDAVSWTIAALTPERLIEIGADPFHLMAFADKNYLVDEIMEGVKVEGYDFTNLKGRRKDYRLLWFEGTGFHIVTMQLMSKFSKSQGFEKRSEYFRQKAAYFLNEMTKASQLLKSINYALPYTAKKPKEKEIYTTFRWEWEIPRGKGGNWVSSASSTAWYFMAISAFNPLGFDKENINYKIFKK